MSDSTIMYGPPAKTKQYNVKHYVKLRTNLNCFLRGHKSQKYVHPILVINLSNFERPSVPGILCTRPDFQPAPRFPDVHYNLNRNIGTAYK